MLSWFAVALAGGAVAVGWAQLLGADEADAPWLAPVRSWLFDTG